MKKYKVIINNKTHIVDADNPVEAVSKTKEELSAEEEQAIADYRKAIENTKDLKLLKLYSHILEEEIEHLEELNNEQTE